MLSMVERVPREDNGSVCQKCCRDWHSHTIIGKVENPCCFKNVRKLPTKYVAIRKAFVT
jgi:hypothetical protein